MRAIKKSHPGVISNPGMPGEKSVSSKLKISPRKLVEMTVAGFVITSLCPTILGEHSKLQLSRIDY